MQHGQFTLIAGRAERSSRCFSNHKVGLLVLFFHDITDIWLELAKSLHYLSARQGDRVYPYWDTLANVGFVIFILCW